MWRRLVWVTLGVPALGACEASSSERAVPSAAPPLTATGTTGSSETSGASTGGVAGSASGAVGGSGYTPSGESLGQGGAGGVGAAPGTGGGFTDGSVGSPDNESGGGGGATGADAPTDTMTESSASADTATSAGSESEDPTGVTSEPTSPGAGSRQPPYILGADVSIVVQDEYWGATYTDQGQQGDVLEILARRGFNYVRLRTFVNPAAPGGYAEGEPEPWCDIAHTAQFAARAKAAGLGVLLDFHYSDTWADPVAQHAPAAWADYGIEELEQAMYDYTFDSVAQMRDAGALPEMVQVGNEITNGIAGVSRSNLEHFARLLKAGVRAVRDADPNILVMLHIERCHDLTTSRAWLNGVLGQGVEFDVFAQSCYGDAESRDGETLDGYHGGVNDWERTLTALAEEYPDLRFAVAEYSSDKRALNDIVYNLPNQAGIGTFLWDTTRWYGTHPIEPVFTTGDEWYDFISIPELMELYEQMARDYGLR